MGHLQLASKSWTAIAETYPFGLADLLAAMVCETIGWFSEKVEDLSAFATAAYKRSREFGKFKSFFATPARA